MSYTLVIGNKNLSSWSLRPWLVLARCQTPFDEVLLKLDTPTFQSEVGQYSAAGKVPILLHKTEGDRTITIWDSLAISEYLAERFPEKNLWPKDPAKRAMARTVTSEMHSGFATLRKNMPMNVAGRLPGQGRAPGVQEDIDRICEIWHLCLSKYSDGGPFLFGDFSIADAFFAPVVTRFTTYAVTIDKTCQQYANAIWSLPEMKSWANAAAKE
jgi:glutathione S-transferase